MKQLLCFLVPLTLCLAVTACSPTSTDSPSESSLPQESSVSQPQVDTPSTLKQQAWAMAETMTAEELVGQMFFVRCPETDGAQAVSQYQFGGYVLFAQDFENKTADEITSAIAAYQAASAVPMIVAVDEEGGIVNRISRQPQLRDQPFSSPQTLYAQGGLELIARDAAEKSVLLDRLGVNVNLAPVCDVSTNPRDYINNRTFGQNAVATADYVRTVVTATQQGGVGCVLKHFPGYGGNADTHTGIAYDNRAYERFVAEDFLPFFAGIKSGAGGVLVCHNIVACMDETLPASLSPEVHCILREELGFEGVIITDDLSMAAIQDYTGNEEAAVLAVLAGNDLICCTDYAVQIPAVLAAVEDGRIPLSQLQESVTRVLLWKLQLGILA